MNGKVTHKHRCDGHYFETICYEKTGTGSRISMHSVARRVRDIGKSFLPIAVVTTWDVDDSKSSVR